MRVKKAGIKFMRWLDVGWGVGRVKNKKWMPREKPRFIELKIIRTRSS